MSSDVRRNVRLGARGAALHWGHPMDLRLRVSRPPPPPAPNLHAFLRRQAVSPQLEKHTTAYAHYLHRARACFDERWSQPDLYEHDHLANYTLLRTIGAGGFGRVVLAARSPEHSEYAIKIIDKQDAVRYEQIEHIVQELRVLDATRFTFLIHLHAYFKTNCCLCMVLPFIAGGDMFRTLVAVGQFDEALARFFGAQVVLALEYLHANGVIYRDLKPENILLDVGGYLKITDFGFCKKIDQKRTWTFCGTPEYLAPEVILSQSYTYSVDWWMLGVLLYEMVAGRSPFHASNDDPMQLYTAIVNGRYSMPMAFTHELRDLLKQLLHTDRHRRYGMLFAGVQDIKAHAWFAAADWDGILARTVDVPPMPRRASAISQPEAQSAKVSLRENEYEEYVKEFAVIRPP